jgi:hypothetical protein
MEPDPNIQVANVLAQLDRHVSTPVAAEFLGVKTRQLELWRRKRRGPRYRKFSRLVRYSIADLKAFAEAGIVNPPQQGADTRAVSANGKEVSA